MAGKNMIRMADYLIIHRKVKDEFFNQVNTLIDWSRISKIIDENYSKSRITTGRPAYSGLLLFKMSLLQTWYGLSDYEVEDRVNDSISFSHFVGLGLEEKVPDHSVLSRFRTELTNKSVYELLFTEINKQLDRHGILIKTGAIIDASIIDSPLKPKKKPSYVIEEDRNKTERTSDDLQAEEKAHELLKKEEPGVDYEARWIKKGNRSRYGYKKHVITDEEGLILGVHTTPANVNEISNLEDVLAHVDLVEGTKFYGDKGYKSKKNDDILNARKLKNRILYKATKNKKLNNNEIKFNKLCSKIRFKVERTFGSTRRWFSSTGSRYKGLAKMHTQNILESIAYNLYRSPNRIFENALNR